MQKTICKICIAKKGLNGKDVFNGTCPYVFESEKDFFEHMKTEHNIRVKDYDYEKGELKKDE